MGNCQAIDAAALVIQHPSGKIERTDWPVSANEDKTVPFTRVKLLRPTDTLVLGRVYRLVTTQEVMKVLRAKKHGKMRKKQQELKENSENQRSSCELEAGNSEPDKDSEALEHERQKQRPGM
ncbi:uncharacterized protein LOC107818201 isoform X2 [Nicotiana tabacum]|uniref:Uncharacterized protein LOC107818201 isoform X2 n=1 Tax=Nicotiana tabacum TaxID=4097 RepID=A0AC58SWF8_TOBAC